jgi:hypothetical protein
MPLPRNEKKSDLIFYYYAINAYYIDRLSNNNIVFLVL